MAVRTHRVTVAIAGTAVVATVVCTCAWRVEVDKDKALRYARAHLWEVGS